MQLFPNKNHKERPGGEARANETIRRRTLVIMFFIGFVLFIPLIIQLFVLQIVRHEELELRAVSQQTRDTVISPTRGTIYDRNMNVLAMSASVETVFISPAEIESDEDARTIALGLSRILEVDYEKIMTMTTKKESYYQVVRSKIDKALADQVRLFILENDNIRGIYLETDYKRYYPYGAFASHVVGFVTNDNLGAEGIEAVYNSELQGSEGRVISAKNARGSDMPDNYEKYYDAEDGYSAVLTIDETVQQSLENNLEQAIEQYFVEERATAIAMDVKTGQILGLAVKGDYDLNSPRVIQSEEILEELEDEELTEEQRQELLVNAQYAQWRNKAVSDAYEPGSTFKIITAAAALEENAVSLEDTFVCNGSLMVAGWDEPISCWKKAGHGTQTFAEGVQNSCNPVFITTGQRLGYEKFYEYMEAFGLLDKTGIDLPGESSGQALSWENFDGQWVSLSVYAFGQTFTVTPIQLITAISAVANDGVLMQPYIVKELVDSNGVIVKSNEPTAVRQVISEETSDVVCQILESVVTEGTGSNAYVAGYRVGGKTGTGEKRSLSKEDQNGNYVVSFVGIAPADDPQVAVLVTLDHPTLGTNSNRSGGIMAAPVVGNIMREILPYLGVEPVYTEAELATIDMLVPDCTGMTEEEAAEALEKAGFASYRVVGDGETVTDQIPAPGRMVPASAQIVLYMGEEKPTDTVEVPNLRGLSAEYANEALTDRGLIMKATGATSSSNTQVSAQSHEPGTEVDRGTVITVQFLNADANDSTH